MAESQMKVTPRTSTDERLEALIDVLADHGHISRGEIADRATQRREGRPGR